MTIIPFPIKPYVLITSAEILEERTGKTFVRYNPPKRTFFLELMDADGRAIVWDGSSYLDALGAASDWAADDVEVRDRVAATWRRT